MDVKKLLASPGGPIPSQVRVRFAPSPTGSLHVGGARSHLFNYIYARATGGKLILRIEDTDQARSTPEFERMVIRDIMSLDLAPDEGPDNPGEYGPYRQSERIPIYKEVALKLLDTKKAYRCFCSEELLGVKAEAAKAAGKPPHYDGTCTNIPREESDKRAAAGEPFSIRMIAPYRDYTLNDLIRGDVTFKAGMVGDFVLVRSNGIPVYNFAVVVDDYFMRISHVIRAEEHLPNTLRQMMISEGLGWAEPKFAHISLVLGLDKKKLSKRHGASSVEDHLQQGYLKEALVNFLALLGWSPSDSKEIRPLSEIIADFRLEKLTKSPAVFDLEKLNWMNGEYIRAMDIKELAKRIAPFVKAAGYNPAANGEEWFLQVLGTVRGNLKRLEEIGQYLEIYYADKFAFEEDAKVMIGTPEAKAVISAFREEVEKNGPPSSDEELTAIQNVIKTKTGAKGKGLFMPMRASVTGKLHGPELKLVLPLLGKTETLRRIDVSLGV